nr:unnamed protein product [Callosobruchus chinensis]
MPSREGQFDSSVTRP